MTDEQILQEIQAILQGCGCVTVPGGSDPVPMILNLVKKVRKDENDAHPEVSDADCDGEDDTYEDTLAYIACAAANRARMKGEGS